MGIGLLRRYHDTAAPAQAEAGVAQAPAPVEPEPAKVEATEAPKPAAKKTPAKGK